MGHRAEIHRRLHKAWAECGHGSDNDYELLFSRAGIEDYCVGTGYAVWTGIGAVGTVTLGIILFGESSSIPRLFCIVLIVAGIVGLKITSPEYSPP
jgi:hypothetical protein